MKNITNRFINVCTIDREIVIKVPKMSDRISRDRNEVPVLVSAPISQYQSVLGRVRAVQFEWGEECKLNAVLCCNVTVLLTDA